MGRAAAPLFAPLGFGDWRAVSAIIAGVTAKEAVVSTLAIMAGNPVGSIEMTQMLTETFTPLSAYCFMTFCLLYIPCIATLVTVRKELGSWKYVLQMILLQISSAWIFSFLFYQFGVLWN
jgi:ferrous iron transport protein B